MKAQTAKLVRALILAAVAVAQLRAQSAEESESRSKILALEHVWNQAEAFKDLKALDALFDNALVYVDFDGAFLTKADFLSRVKSAHLQQVVTESMTVQVFGSTAIASGTYKSSELANGKTVARRGRFVDTWVYRGSTWVCVAAQATPILR